MKKTVSFFVTVLMTVNFLMAQSLAEGIKDLDYEKNKSAMDVLQKTFNANPKDPQAIYWLGQAMIANGNVKGAKDLYQKSLADGVNDPWIWVGQGHTDILLGGDINAAKQKFEQAITATTETRGKNKGKPAVGILNAIGRANAIGHDASGSSAKLGDPVYGIDKLKQAATIDPLTTNPDIFINMGILYLKTGGEQGGEAVKAYQEAIQHDPKNARAMYRIGLIYKSQNNLESLTKYFGDAIAADPTFAPAYLALFDYYSLKDVNRAKEYIDNFLKYADKDPANDVYYADYLFRAGKYNESLAKVKEIDAAAGAANVPQLNILYAYNYNKLGDSVQAKSYAEKFFATAPPELIKPENYDIAIDIFSKFPGSEAQTASYIQKAIDNDTSRINKGNLMDRAGAMYAKSKDYANQMIWMQKKIDLNGGRMGEYDYFQMTSTALNMKDYTKTIDLAKKYMAAFPDKPQPYSIFRRASVLSDPDTSGPVIANLIYLDSLYYIQGIEKRRSDIFKNLYYMINYYVYKTKELDKALDVANKMLELYPAPGGEENTYASGAKGQIETGIEKLKHPPAPARQGSKSSGGNPPK